MTIFEEVLGRLASIVASGVLACAVVGCGGSASETPPPMEPSSNPRAPYGRTAQPSSSSEEPSGDDADEASDDEPEDEGSSGAEPAPAPLLK